MVKRRVTSILDYELPRKKTRSTDKPATPASVPTSTTSIPSALTPAPTLTPAPASASTTGPRRSGRVTRAVARASEPSPVIVKSTKSSNGLDLKKSSEAAPPAISPEAKPIKACIEVAEPIDKSDSKPSKARGKARGKASNKAVGKTTEKTTGKTLTKASGVKKPAAKISTAKKPQPPADPLQESLASFAYDEGIKARQDEYLRQEILMARGGERRDKQTLVKKPSAKDGAYFEMQVQGTSRYPKKSGTHPKILQAERRGTWNWELVKWYQYMPKGDNIPRAGIPSAKPYTPKDDDLLELEETFHTRPSVKLIVPDILKAMLVDDWENVTKNNQLVPLPHPRPVTKILEDYAAYETPKRPAGSSHVDILEETLAGLKEYFDKSLGRILLYRFERAQYAEMHKKWMSDDPEFAGKTASDTYGPEHFMRLLVSLPELIAQTNMDQQSVNRLREEMVKFCTWLSKHTADYFVSIYESPSQDYIQKCNH